MPMIHSAYSCVPAHAVHQVREMGRYHARWCDWGWFPETTNARAATQVNSIRPRYASCWWPTRQIGRSLPPEGKKWNGDPLGQPGWLEAARADRIGRRLGRPYRVSGSEAAEGQALCGNHNRSVPGRESARPIRARKSGNADGAKGPYFWEVCKTRKGEPLEKRLDYGKPAPWLCAGKGDGPETLFAEMETRDESQTGTRIQVLCAL